MAISPDGETLAVSGYREILLHKSTGGLVARLPGLSERIHSLAFSPDGKTLAAVGGNPARFGELQIWDVATQKQKHSVVLTNDTLFGASFSPDGTKLAFGAADKSIRIFDVASGKEIRKADHHEDWVFGTAFGVDGKRLVSVSRDRAAKLADASTGAFIENVNLLKEALYAVVRHPKKDWVLIGGEERIPYLYRMDRPRAMRIADDSTLIRKFDKQDGPILALSISPDAKLIAVGSAVGDVRIYNLDTGDPVASCSGQQGGIYALQFYPDSRRLAAAGFDGTVRVYDTTGKMETAFVPAPIEKTVVSKR
jgi:WD40 repeat protein